MAMPMPEISYEKLSYPGFLKINITQEIYIGRLTTDNTDPKLDCV